MSQRSNSARRGRGVRVRVGRGSSRIRRVNPTHFIRNTTGTRVFPFSIVQWTAINACEKPDITFENTHIENLANDYQCAICMELLTNPTSAGTCGHLFCSTCISSTIRAQSNTNPNGVQCPTCRDPMIPANIRLDNHAKRVIGNLHIKCPNHQITNKHNALFSQRRHFIRETSNRNRNRNRNRRNHSSDNARSRSRSRSRSRERNNSSNSNNSNSNNESKSNEENEISVFCSWTGEYRNLKEHLKTCELEIASCTRCNMPILRRKMELHENNECLWLPIECELCHIRFVQCERHLHAKVCPKKVISCTYCEERHERRNMQQHWKLLCLNYPLKCQFNEHGCNEVVIRANMQRHLNEKQKEHLQMIAQKVTNTNEWIEKFNALDEKYDELEGNYDELQGDYNELEDRCNDLEEKCEELEGQNEELKEAHQQLKRRVDVLFTVIGQIARH